ncbi:pathogen-associated molecular patterns-induced protein A70 [Eucalyptus grandis]|uniref:pathogen-associated molecular patterns-induced protein A70 n=1 Tax=Eucalyptus grandis TaxID=71139 RepID=UPI00192EDFDE|nr:pathogen-associated molecular patterns-induced protein A70 [Eucalyptus grandis]
MWAFMEGWLTPSSLFILLNITIGTIVLTSRLSSSPRKPLPHHYHDHLGPDHAPPLARAPSLLQRVRSIDFSLYKFGHHGGGYPEPEPEPAHARYEPHSYPDHGYAGHVDAPHSYPDHGSSYPEPQFSHPADPPPLARAPSFVDRLKSFDFSLYKYQAPSYPQPQADHDERPSGPEYADRAEPPRLARAPSLLERVKSIKLSSFYRSSEPDPDEDAPHHLGVDSDSEDDDSVPYADAGWAREDHQVRRVRSDPKPTTPGEGSARRLPAKMKKSASERSAVGHFEDEEEEDPVERRRPETARGGRKKSGTAAAPAPEEEDEIDAKADAFINRFKRDLKLERLDSIMRFEEMLSRGAS